jgi:hypothetical protein
MWTCCRHVVKPKELTRRRMRGQMSTGLFNCETGETLKMFMARQTMSLNSPHLETRSRAL